MATIPMLTVKGKRAPGMTKTGGANRGNRTCGGNRRSVAQSPGSPDAPALAKLYASSGHSFYHSAKATSSSMLIRLIAILF